MRKWRFLRWRNARALPWETKRGGAYRQGEEGQDFQEVGTACGKAQRHKIACICRVLPVLWWGQGGTGESCVIEVDQELCIPLEQRYLFYSITTNRHTCFHILTSLRLECMFHMMASGSHCHLQYCYYQHMYKSNHISSRLQLCATCLDNAIKMSIKRLHIIQCWNKKIIVYG